MGNKEINSEDSKNMRELIHSSLFLETPTPSPLYSHPQS